MQDKFCGCYQGEENYWFSYSFKFEATKMMRFHLNPKIISKSNKESHHYQDSLEQAKREEFKGNFTIAIDKYQDTLYYLKNDYQNLNPKWKVSHQNLINNIQSKIEGLKVKISDIEKTS